MRKMRDRFLCNIEIRGPIETGDAERLQGIFDAQFQNPPPDPTGWIACLDSAGGQFEAGIALGEVLARYGWATRVRQDAECLSACAVAFLFGTFVAYDNALNLRIMDRGARVGFHAPRLQYDGDDVPGAVVGQAYDAALIGLGNLMNAAMNAPRLAPRRGPAPPPAVRHAGRRRRRVLRDRDDPPACRIRHRAVSPELADARKRHLGRHLAGPCLRQRASRAGSRREPPAADRPVEHAPLGHPRPAAGLAGIPYR